MRLEHYYSDVNGTNVGRTFMVPPSEEAVKKAIKYGRAEMGDGFVFSDGKVVEVKVRVNAGPLRTNLYRDMYRIIN